MKRNNGFSTWTCSFNLQKKDTHLSFCVCVCFSVNDPNILHDCSIQMPDPFEKKKPTFKLTLFTYYYRFADTVLNVQSFKKINK